MLKTLAILAVVGLLIGWGSICHRAGRKASDAYWATEQAKAVQRALQRQEMASQASAKVGAEHEARSVEIRTVYRTITREVPHVVTPEMDRAYPLSVGWVRLHDAGALGVPLAPDPTGRPDDAASDVASSDAIGTILDNYETASECRATVLAWQDYWRGVSSSYQGAPASSP